LSCSCAEALNPSAGAWTASYPAHFTPLGNDPDSHCARGWVATTPGLDALKTEISYLWWESNHNSWLSSLEPSHYTSSVPVSPHFLPTATCRLK